MQKALEVPKSELRAWVSLETLAKQFKVSCNTISRALARAKGLETRLNKNGQVGRPRREYRVKP